MNRCFVFILALGLAAGAAAAKPDASANVSISVLEKNVLCVRASRVTEDFAQQLRAQEPTNHIAGTVLDLRFANGDDGAVTAAEKWFAAKKTPLAILVNGETRGAAATLAKQLRAAGDGIVIGSTNPPGIVSPDIALDVSAATEKKYLENPYASQTTNAVGEQAAKKDLLPFVDHTSEADLVREHIKDGQEDEANMPPRPRPSEPLIHDPALARAVDLLKALAVLHVSRG